MEHWGCIGCLYGLFHAEPCSRRDYSNGILKAESPAVYNRFQRYMLEHSRLCIPILIVIISEAFDHCTQEIARLGVHLALISLLDVARDPRWGRSEEAYGEDPALTARIAGEVVAACQRSRPGRPRIGVVVKHFAGQE